jgi:hypothetical protein
MDYLNGTHIAKWQWDLMHDPGVVVRVFEKDADAMKVGGFVTDAEYLIHDGNYADLENGLYHLYKSAASDAMKKLFSTKTVNDFLEKIRKSEVLNNLIFESGHATGRLSTIIGFLVPKIKGGNDGISFLNTKTMEEDVTVTEEIYKKSKLCINIWFAGRPNDHELAHELLIHNVDHFNEINKIQGFNKLSKREAIDKIIALYTNNDNGDEDHYKFIIGEKKEMTEYTLERLEQMQTVSDKLNYLCIYLSEIGKYTDKNAFPNIIIRHGGYNEIITNAKDYIKRDFAAYKSYIFEPWNKLNIDGNILHSDLNEKNKNKTLWQIFVEKE